MSHPRRARRPLARTAAALALPLALTGSPAPAAAAPGAAAPAAAPAAAAPARAAADGPVTPAERRMAAALTRRLAAAGLGPRVGAVVRDAASGRRVWGSNSRVGYLPASTTKVGTAVAALRVLPASHRFRTRVTTGRRPSQVVLVGGGDPSLSTAHLGGLAATTAADLRRRGVRRVVVFVDDSRYPAPRLAAGWRAGYYPATVAPVRALIVDQHMVQDTALDAGRVFARRLAARGVPVATVVRAPRPRGARTLAAVHGERLDAIVGTTLKRSDNDMAEYLLRETALATGRTPDWAGSNAALRAVLAGLGVPLAGVVQHDGSGLSRSARLTPQALAHLLGVVASPRHPELKPVRDGLPVAGVDGTLRAARGRFTTAPSSCARGRLVAKTGTLRDVVTLAGITRGADGRLKTFAFMVNGPASSLAVKRKVDALAATVTGCW